MRAGLLAALMALPAMAHEGEVHAPQKTLQAALPDTLFPQDFGGAYRLTDHHGRARTEADPEGRLQLIFFGYATCEAICTVALPIMAEIAEALEGRGIGATPLVITVDPEVDTVESMGPALAAFAPGLTGLTGSEADLAAVRALFHVEREALFEDVLGRTVYAHGSHIYVMDAQGGFLTLLPPILTPERMVEIVEGYAAG